jgi:hypothetical protein
MKLLKITASDRIGKRFTAFFDIDGKTKKVHFGSEDGSTFIDHKDETKKENYLKRHKVNERWDDPLTAGALAKHLLWNKPTLSESIADFKVRFSV